jgi:hypothetical protein
MNTNLIKSLIELVKAEELSRENARSLMPADAADYQATFRDTPLTNELYLLVLLFIWHEIEKEIVLIAALSGSQDASPITRDDYRKKVTRLEKLNQDRRKRELEKLLPALDPRAWDLLDVLRLLANSFKHDPFDKPKGVLIERLGLPKNMNYAPMSESGAVRFGLAKFLGIGDDASFSQIVDAVCKSCDRILLALRAGTPLRSFDTGERVSLNPDTFER